MKYMKTMLPIFLTAILVIGLTGTSWAQRRTSSKAAPQLKKPAPLSIYGQGYQKGYNDGHTQGGKDYGASLSDRYRQSEAYQNRENLYDPKYVSSDEYVEGYELGFRLGYSDGYYGRARNASVPTNGETLYKATALARAQQERAAQRAADRSADRSSDRPSDRPSERDRSTDRPSDRPSDRSSDRMAGPSRPRSTRPLDIPVDTEMRLKLTSTIDTKTNHAGDRFTATVMMPGEYEGATVEGHIEKLDKSGRIKGRTEMSLLFDSITMPDGRRADFSAQLEKVIESENVKMVDEEGNVQTGSRTKDSQVRGGIGATAGAVIGGIAGGVKGAILGAIIGGAAGVGTVYIEGEKQLILEPGTELVIRTDRRTR